VGFHLVPVFNLYWAVRWPIAFSKFIKKNDSVPIFPGWLLGLFLLLCLFIGRAFDGAISLFCIFSLFAYMTSKLRKKALLFEAMKTQIYAQQPAGVELAPLPAQP